VRDIALKYLERGWSVLPVHSVRNGVCSCGNPQCPSPGKHPRIKWSEFTRTRATEDQIRGWWSKWPDSNVGVITGPISDLAVIDIDGPTGEQSAQDLNLPDTLSVSTGGGGRHLYYQYPAGRVVLTRTSIMNGIDVRGESGFVVAPPSIHKSGGEYAWINRDVPITEYPDIGTDPKTQEVTITPQIEMGEIPSGQRNDTLTRLAGSLLGQGHNIEHTAQVVMLTNAARCKPPLKDGEVIRIVESIASAEMRKLDLDYINHKLKMPVPITAILKYGNIDSTWVMVLADKRQVRIGPISKLYQHRIVRDAIADVTRHTIRISNKEWLSIAAKFVELGVEVEDEERLSDVEQWVLKYVGDPPRLSMSDRADHNEAVRLLSSREAVGILDADSGKLYIVLDAQRISHIGIYVSIGIKSVSDAARRIRTVANFKKIRISGNRSKDANQQVVCWVSRKSYDEELD